MQTLGLSGESRRSDGPVKSIFWPTVDNAWDVDYLGHQGFWICAVVAVIQLAAGVLSGSPFIMAIYLVTALIFFVGGMGVREASWPAAAMVFGLFSTGLLNTMASGRLPGILSILVAGVLLSNVRAAFLASEWRPASEGEDRPTRFNESLTDKLVDQWPAKLWPRLQPYFFSVASAILALELIGLGLAVWRRLASLSIGVHPSP
ncbi:MAG: hypothetical protein ABSF23_07180 [Terracidiphilus sp.]|jgi:hypothetical protein